MTNIICDTSIWYELAKGLINVNKLDNVKLIATEVNLHEIAYSPNLLKKFELIKDAARSMKKYRNDIILTNPYEHIISLFDNTYKPNYKKAELFLKQIDILINIDDISEVSPNNISSIEKSLEKYHDAFRPLLDSINEKIAQNREDIQSFGGKYEFRKLNFLDSRKLDVITIINSYSTNVNKKELKIDDSAFDWEKIEFFLEVFDEYYKLLVLRNNGKFHLNDWHDLYNMVYVKPGFKYWTNDKIWQRDLQLNDKCKAYFYNEIN